MADLKEYKCPNCGGAIAFDPHAQKLICPYCDTEFDIETLNQFNGNLDIEDGEDMSWQSEEAQFDEGEMDDYDLYVCQSCGGEIIADQNTGATSCPFCGNPVVMTGKFAGRMKPDLIIPFQKDKKEAKQALMNHVMGKKLLPPVFKDENHIDEIKGVYVPFWLFDTDVDADMTYHATQVRSWSDRDFIYTETMHFQIVRGGTLDFEHIPVDGDSKIEDVLMESIEPFRFEDAVPFQTAYLAGYLADIYDVPSEQCEDRANERLRTTTEQTFRNTVQGYATVVPEARNIRLQNAKVHYALLPVWLLCTSWNGDNYIFAMNGQTGKFVGDLPADKSLVTKSFVSTCLITVVLVFAIQLAIYMFG